jgi:two-component system sensor histidine kinase/response regulator
MESSAVPARDNASPQSVWTLPEELRQLARDGAADVVADIVAVFQEDTASRLEVLQEAVRNGNCTLIRAEAHAIKGSSAQLGVAAMARMCFQLEQVGNTVDVAEAAGLLAQIREHFAEVGQAMSTLKWGDAEYGG